MAGLGSVSFNILASNGITFSFDESICGILFDYGMYDSPFSDHPILENYFGNNTVQLINNLQEIESMGLDDAFMNGVPHYHIQQFYDYIGADMKLYVMFANCINNEAPDFEVIQSMQQQANGQIFQLGIWTEQSVWCSQNDSELYGFTSVIGQLESQAEVLSGRVNKTYSDGLPLSIILNANTAMLSNQSIAYGVNYRKVPYALSLGCPKVSLVLGQNGTDEVHDMQLNNHNGTPVGFLGITLACLALASAEMSIAYVDRFDLNKNDDVLYPELGFGSISDKDYNAIQSLNQVRRNELSLKGYILPTTYESKETGVYFSNDQTLSDKDFNSISLNRLAHKCRRIIRSVMFPHINGNLQVDNVTGSLSNTAMTQLNNEIIKMLDFYMVNTDGQDQISGRDLSFENTKDILETDTIYVDCYIIPVSSNMQLDIQEEYILSE